MKQKATTGKYKLFERIPVSPFNGIWFSKAPSPLTIKEGDILFPKQEFILRKSGVLLYLGSKYRCSPLYFGGTPTYGCVRSLVEMCLSIGLCTKEDVSALKEWCKENERKADARNAVNAVWRAAENLSEADKDTIVQTIRRDSLVEWFRARKACDDAGDRVFDAPSAGPELQRLADAYALLTDEEQGYADYVDSTELKAIGVELGDKPIRSDSPRLANKVTTSQEPIKTCETKLILCRSKEGKTRYQCPKCGRFSADAWEYCGGRCPQEGSPHYDASLTDNDMMPEKVLKELRDSVGAITEGESNV